MNLIHECTMSASLRAPLPIGAGPVGTRMYFDVIEGKIEGERLNARLLGGGEWGLIGPDGFLRVDVRLQAETDDGAFLYIQYTGLLGLNDAVQGALGNHTGTEYGDQYFFTNPRIETGDARYAWLNNTFFIGEGRFLPGHKVEYRISRPEAST